MLYNHEKCEDLTADEITSMWPPEDRSKYRPAAEEALEENMVDQLGYFDDAVETAMELANIDKARVVEYERPFSFVNIFGGQSGRIFKLDRNKLYELSTPQVMYLWSAY